MPPIILKSQPGIKRDGTKFDGDFYTDGQWVRFQRGLPRKIGGFRSLPRLLDGPARGITDFSDGQYVILHVGGNDRLEQFTLDTNFNMSMLADRTPTTLGDSPLVATASSSPSSSPSAS